MLRKCYSKLRITKTMRQQAEMLRKCTRMLRIYHGKLRKPKTLRKQAEMLCKSVRMLRICPWMLRKIILLPPRAKVWRFLYHLFAFPHVDLANLTN